jgi:TPR repeat protein
MMGGGISGGGHHQLGPGPGACWRAPRHEGRGVAGVWTKVQPAREPAPPPASGSSLYELGRYEERRRVQERMRHADAADYEDGNLSAARNLYDYAAAKGWAHAALALAFTYDPNELQRRGVTVPGDPIKARACYIKASELMDAAETFYLSRLPSGSPGGREEKC